MKNQPEKIYLNVGFDREPETDFNELSGVTWSAEPVHDDDLEYVSKHVANREWNKQNIRHSETAGMLEIATRLLREARAVINSMGMSMTLHPDCKPDSEFGDEVLSAKDAINKIDEFLSKK